jgi:hypothetical protein
MDGEPRLFRNTGVVIGIVTDPQAIASSSFSGRSPAVRRSRCYMSDARLDDASGSRELRRIRCAAGDERHARMDSRPAA